MRKRKQDPFRRDLRRVTILHVAFLGLFVFVSWWVARDRPLKPDETVTFVDMAASGGAPETTPVNNIPAPPAPPERDAPPPPAPPLVVKPPDVEKPSAIPEVSKKPDKQKTPKTPDRSAAPPQTNTTHKVEVSRTRVTHAVAAAGPGAADTRTPERSTRPAGRRYSQGDISKMLQEGIGGSSGRAGVLTGGDADSAMGWYYALVKQILYEAWNQPTTISLAAAPLTEVVIRVERSGRIIQRKLYRPSGNVLMDQSVMQAVNSVDRLRPLPAEALGPYRDIVIQFELSHN